MAIFNLLHSKDNLCQQGSIMLTNRGCGPVADLYHWLHSWSHINLGGTKGKHIFMIFLLMKRFSIHKKSSPQRLQKIVCYDWREWTFSEGSLKHFERKCKLWYWKFKRSLKPDWDLFRQLAWSIRDNHFCVLFVMSKLLWITFTDKLIFSLVIDFVLHF